MIVKKAVVEPEILPPSIRLVVPFLHWYDKTVPVVITENPIESPAQAVWSVGSEVITAPPMVNEAKFDVSSGKQVPVTIKL